MKAVRFHEVGGPEVLKYEEIAQPIPGVGQVRLRVAASAFSAADNGIRAGFLSIPVVLPHIPGYDVSGTIDALGDGVDGFAVGDAVIAFLPMATDGGAAEYVIAPADALVAAPTSVPLADAAALPSVALTARQALFDDGGLKAGQRALIVGAGGVVGKYAIALAKRAGAYVIATASPRSADAVRQVPTRSSTTPRPTSWIPSPTRSTSCSTWLPSSRTSSPPWCDSCVTGESW